MILNYTKNDDDLKFICYFVDNTFSFVLSDALSIDINGERIEDLDQVISCIYDLHGEEATPKSIAEFKKGRIAPRPLTDSLSMVSLINYINIVKQMLLGGTLKHKDYIDEFTRKYSIPLDPDFYLLEIRAGKIEEIETIEGMDKVYREKVLTNKPLTICSGLRSSCTMESLRGNAYLFVLNIKKIKLRGTESEGMICCTRNDDTIEPLRVFKDPNTKICLENRLELFTDLEYGKIDISKPKYKAALESFSVIENSLCFKGVKVLCDGEYINTKISNGPVS